MPPKTPRTPLKKQGQEEEDLENLVFLREEQTEVIDRLKAKIDATLVEERTEAAAKVHRWRLDTCFAEFAAIKERIYRADPKKRNDHKKVVVEFEALFDQLAMTLGGWNAGAAPAASSALVERHDRPIVIQQPLPRVFPSFDGKYENWEKFKVMFVDVVDKTNESARMKLYHLEKALIGDAAGFIDAKTIQDGNYAHAWKQLTDHYEDKRRMVDLHIGGLLSVKKLACEGHLELRALVDSVVGNVENLKYLGQEFTGVSEQIVVYLLGHALDDDTRKVWESTVAKGAFPKYDEMIKTLKDRISVLERCDTTNDESPRQQHQAKSTTTNQPYQISNTAVTSSPRIWCDFCNGRHLTFKCTAFSGLTVRQRMQEVKEKRVCFNCLRAGHSVKRCIRTSSCGKCQRRHHTLLHDFYQKSTTLQRPVPAVRQTQEPLSPAEVICNPTPMLQTAIVNLRDDNNRPVPCRILIDSGSQVNFISNSMATRLNLRRVAVNVPICGIGGATFNAKETITVKLQSQHSDFSADVECLIVPKVSGKIPSLPVNSTDWPIPKGLQLADLNFHIPGSIDMLVGASWFFRLLKGGHIQLWDNFPELRETHLGWVVVGGAEGAISGQQYTHTATLDTRAAMFLKVPDRPEEVSAGSSPSPGGGCWIPNLSRKNGNTCHRRNVCCDRCNPVFSAQRQPLLRSTTEKGEGKGA
ncbi:uncharacterized protein LOC119766222 [Culex quinquefasciatus]|uniref:uncharacterized protein LOC119766222 n=1 Tax=Culex quinquefasciatus TaxID=7176 RepID=UPI0018E34A72|nr:uncharacterized protein LOC119766222 [Culex quinquefasciatus]